MDKAAKKPDVLWQQILCSAFPNLSASVHKHTGFPHPAEAGYQLTGNATEMQNVEKKHISLCALGPVSL